MSVAVGKGLTKTGAILDFATRLQCDETYQADPSFYLNVLPIVPAELPAAERVKLDKQGVALWNTCIRLKGSCVANQEWLSKTRAFAFFLLESADDTNSSTQSGHARAIKNALKTARECLNAELLDLARRVLEIAAGRHQILIINPAYEDPGDHKQYAPLSLEFYSLRLALAWRQGRFDLAEHFYTKINTIELQRWGLATESLLDLLFEIAKQHLNHKRPEAAVKWLARAQKLFDTVDLADLSPDASDLRMVVLHTYAQALLDVNSPEAALKTYDVLDVLQRDYGGKLAVMLLHLEMNFRGPDANVEACYTSLSAIARSAHLTESNFKIIIHYGHKLYAYEEELAIKVVQDFLLQRLVTHGNDGWIECALLTILSMGLKTVNDSVTGRQSGPMLAPAEVQRLLHLVHQSWGKILELDAAQAALVLLWKAVESAAEDHNSASCSDWCQTALHIIFNQAGPSNIGKIQRKLVQYYLKRSDAASAREVLSQMAAETQSHPLSRYLLYCTATRLEDEDLASTALRLDDFSGPPSRLLYACISETLRLGDRKQGIRVLRRLLERYFDALIPEVDLGALLRCLIQLLIAQLEGNDCNVVWLLTQIREVLGIARNQIRDHFMSVHEAGTAHNEGPLFFLDVEWLSKTTFELVTKRCKEWPHTVVLELLDHCLGISCALCGNSSPWNPTDQQMLTKYPARLKWRIVTTIFTRTLIHTAMAREAASLSSRADSYQEVQNNVDCHVDRYHGLICEQDMTNKDLLEDIEAQFRKQRTILLPLKLEAVLVLHQREDFIKPHMGDTPPDKVLSRLLETAHELDAPAETYGLLAGIILSALAGGGGENAKEPLITVELASQLMKQLIGVIRRRASYNTAQASRWIRCLVQIVTDTRPGMRQDKDKTQLIEGLVEQALVVANHARSRTVAGKDQASIVAYPSEELEWLATTLFNLAVDFYVAESGEMAKKWAGKAVEVADVLENGECGAGDGGTLARVLRGKMAELGW